jgi:excinuclease ABC subunit C
MATVELGDRDVFGIKTGPAGAAIQVFQVREGRVVERMDLSADVDAGAEAAESESGMLQAAVQQFYEDREVPPEIHVPVALPEAEAVEAWLSARAGRRVRVAVPRRGEKRGLLDLAVRNAAMAYETRFNEEQAAHYDGLETLRGVLSLPAFPRRIECFDISTLQGSETVASLVVCEDGRMKRSEYRKFKIRDRGSGIGDRGSGIGDQGQRFLDDFAAMNQVVMRRYQRVLERGGPFPDLIVIDGGKGQLSAAYAALEDLGLSNLVAVGLAKKEELVFTRSSDLPIALPRGGDALRVLQMIRDEAHRFAVTFHRQARRARDLQSGLDEIPGVGPRRRRALLTAFGSLAGVRRASREDLSAVIGPKLADVVLKHFAAQG